MTFDNRCLCYLQELKGSKFQFSKELDMWEISLITKKDWDKSDCLWPKYFLGISRKRHRSTEYLVNEHLNQGWYVIVFDVINDMTCRSRDGVKHRATVTRLIFDYEGAFITKRRDKTLTNIILRLRCLSCSLSESSR